MKYPAAALLLTTLAAAPALGQAQLNYTSEVFVAGVDYPVYRIPGMNVAADGSVLVFVEARPNGSDAGGVGNIDLVMKRSTDNGQTWSSNLLIHSDPDFDYADMAAVVNPSNNQLILSYSQFPDRAGLFGSVPGFDPATASLTLTRTSDDNGLTWSAATDITTQVKDPTWQGHVTGEDQGIVLNWQDNNPSLNGRIMFTGYAREASGELHSNVFYTDDGGANWATSTTAPTGSSEAEVVELTDGRLLLNSRQDTSGGPVRRQHISTDGGATWSNYDTGVAMSNVDASLIRYSAKRSGDDRDRLLFVGPAGSPAGAANGRNNLAIWTSYDEGKSYINPTLIASGSAAYSVVNKLNDGSIGVIYEINHNSLDFINLNMASLEGATHSANMSHFDGFGNTIDSNKGGVGWSGAWGTSGNVSQQLGGLEFDMMAVDDDAHRTQFDGGTMTRDLGTSPIDLDANQDYFVSLFVRSDDDGNNQNSGENFEIELQSGATTKALFGIQSREAFRINADTNAIVKTSNGTALIDTTYFLLAKIAASDTGLDQLMFAWYDDASAIPANEAAIVWQLTDSFDSAALIDSIFIDAGSNATWNADALRIGTTFDSVVFTDGSVPEILGDLNADGVIDLGDWVVFKTNFTMDTSGEFIPAQQDLGDLNTDGLIDLLDLIAFRDQYDAFNGAGSSASLGAVPEPGSLAILGLSAICLMRRRRRA